MGFNFSDTADTFLAAMRNSPSALTPDYQGPVLNQKKKHRVKLFQLVMKTSDLLFDCVLLFTIPKIRVSSLTDDTRL